MRKMRSVRHNLVKAMRMLCYGLMVMQKADGHAKDSQLSREEGRKEVV